jgi:hypothetical protein
VSALKECQCRAASSEQDKSVRSIIQRGGGAFGGLWPNLNGAIRIVAFSKSQADFVLRSFALAKVRCPYRASPSSPDHHRRMVIIPAPLGQHPLRRMHAANILRRGFAAQQCKAHLRSRLLGRC